MGGEDLNSGNQQESRIWPRVLCCLALGIGVLAIYAQTFWHGFAALDDPQYVADNPFVRDGLTIPGLLLAFAPGYAANWHPLTWISLMLDVEFFGFNPAGYHVVNTLLHAANAALLFLWLRVLLRGMWRAEAETELGRHEVAPPRFASAAMEGRACHGRTDRRRAMEPTQLGRHKVAPPRAVDGRWRAGLVPAARTDAGDTRSPLRYLRPSMEGRVALWAAFIAAAFWAWHPLRVESVAWISQRKDVLSAFWALLALCLHARTLLPPCKVGRDVPDRPRAEQDDHPTPPSQPGAVVSAALARDLAIWVCFALALMSKQTVIMLPVLLLLLEWVGLRRVAWSRLAPLFVFAAATGALTFLAQDSGGATRSVGDFPLWARVVNAGLAIGIYLRQTVWPTGLATFYPCHPFTIWQIVVGLGLWGVAGAALSYACWLAFRARPSAAVAAPRAAVLLLGLGWFLASLLPVLGLIQVGGQAHADRYTYWPAVGLAILMAWGLARAAAKPWRVLLLFVLLGALLAQASWQAGRWRSTEVLFRHALAVTERNFLAHGLIGLELSKQGRAQEAVEHLRAAAAILPDGRNLACLGNALLDSGQRDEARQVAARAIAEFPEEPLVQALTGRLSESHRQD